MFLNSLMGPPARKVVKIDNKDSLGNPISAEMTDEKSESTL